MTKVNKKIIYVANIRLPTEKAHGIQIMEMCSAFANNGDEVALVVPRRFNRITDDPFEYYDIKKNFSITRLPCIDTVSLGKWGYLFQALTFTLSTVVTYIFTRGHIFYTRDEMMALCFFILGKQTVWEGHRGEKNILIKLLIRFKIKMVLISEGLRELYVGMGADPKSVFVAPDAADIDRFDLDISREEARDKLGLPRDKKIILYKGGMFSWKGPGTLAQSFEYLKHKDVAIVFIGGTEKDVVVFKKEFGSISNLLILGNRSRRETPVYQKAADILVIPNSAKEDISKLYTSPMKLFGYMAGGRPIVASDLPSIREILNESNACFFIPDDAVSLAKSIDNVLDNYPEFEKRATVALDQVQKYSWKNRAKNICEFILADKASH